MIGLIIIAVALAYLLISSWVVKRASRAAKRRGVAGWKWGLPAALMMYLLVFWDLIPTLVAHKYYCSRCAGFTVYKTLEEWKEENPNISSELVAFSDSLDLMPTEPTKYGHITKINRRLNREFRKTKSVHFSMIPITTISISIVDNINGTKLAEDIDYKSGYGNMMTSTDWRAMKFWLYGKSCLSDKERRVDRGLYAYTRAVIELKAE